MTLADTNSPWPELPYAALRPTMETLQLWTQIVGKVRLVQTPWVNHSWHVTLYVSAHGLTTGLIPHGALGFELEFDFISHALIIRVSNGGQDEIPLVAGRISDFYAATLAKLAALGVPVAIDIHPNELPDPTPFPQDTALRDYDPDAAHRFWLALVQCDRVFKLFRTRFIGKCSPVHFFWGSFDFAVTRFSGRAAPPHPGGIPHLPDAVTREAYSHEVSSAGFWPGSGTIDYAAFYSYCYPVAPGFADAPVKPSEARFDPQLGEFLLPYEAVRNASDPDAALLAFPQSTYEAAANGAAWDRNALEVPQGECGHPRTI
ncbi:DUF5996 family protein [Methyloferula stellata]|uniref:DUF5996 family protein n=1 Tax=Methyloferula stellata TaxID=876270 RepID=UPI00035D1334|nr:DUF5996 family protein [Methyloferula stellata]